MKRDLLVLLTATSLLAGVQAADKVQLKDLNDKYSYSQGTQYGRFLERQGMTINYDAFVQGVKDAMGEGDLMLSDEELQKVAQEMQPIIQAKMKAHQKELGEKNKAEGEKFLAENAKKEGVITLPSGLQYKVITQGTGPVATTNDLVQTHYTGRFVNGKVFDSSKRHNGTFDTKPTGVIKGWTEALTMMKAGSKWELYVPSDLAYGERGRGNIPPNATLIFEMEVVGVKPATQPGPPPPLPSPITSDIVKVPSAEELKKGAKIEIIKPEQVKEEAAKQQQQQQQKK
ncbi:MAG TPA: FKBP-type peptidyl-prolyl cis-trans isomerase [Verrucomicrobiae bacterium]|nr:FKBP-type peptidyl-prolyl cis-trans isomerase [Verrucomicrobiae bacterium]